MKRIRSSICVLSVFFCMNGVVYASEETLCNPDEIMVASCRANEKKHRILSFCSDADKKTMTYRFGMKSKIELSATFSSSTPISRWVDRATYTTYFGFGVSEYTYVFGIPQETFGAKAFLEVAKRNKSVMNRECTDNSFGEKELNSKAVRDVKDSEVRDNSFLFPPDDH